MKMWVEAVVPRLSVGKVAIKPGFQSLLHKIVATKLYTVGGISAGG